MSTHDDPSSWQDCPGRGKDAPHHPHYGAGGCEDDFDCGCHEFLWCCICRVPWPCEVKQAHVAARRAQP